MAWLLPGMSFGKEMIEHPSGTPLQAGQAAVPLAVELDSLAVLATTRQTSPEAARSATLRVAARIRHSIRSRLPQWRSDSIRSTGLMISVTRTP